MNLARNRAPAFIAGLAGIRQASGRFDLPPDGALHRVRPVLRLLPLPFSIALCLPALADDKPVDWNLCPVMDAIPSFDQAEPPKPGVPAAKARASSPPETISAPAPSLASSASTA